KKGKRRTQSKKGIKEKHPFVRPLNNEKAVEYKVDHGRDLTNEYRAWIDENFNELSPDELSKRTERR
ncbi:MAG: hypothetical protein ACPGVG_02055, partial [Mycobacterium sp.]